MCNYRVLGSAAASRPSQMFEELLPLTGVLPTRDMNLKQQRKRSHTETDYGLSLAIVDFIKTIFAASRFPVDSKRLDRDAAFSRGVAKWLIFTGTRSTVTWT